MKMNLRRMLALTMALLIAATCLGSMTLTSHAAGGTTTDAYVLKYEGADAKPYLYGSRYEFKHSYNDPDAGENSVWTYYNCPEIFNLVSTIDGHSIAAYCTDADSSTQSDTSYRRINLEDATFYAPGAAGKLRAIVLSSFPYMCVEDVAAAATAAGYPVVDLQQGELISATQQAIWETAHGDKYTVDDHSTGLRSMHSYSESDFVYPESLDATLGENTAANMENLYNYFLSLEPMAPMTDAVSEYTFENVVYNAECDDGLYTITVTFTIHTVIDQDDELTLTATCGDQVYTEALHAGECSVSFTGVAGPEEVKLEINGYEQGGDVYLFDAVGDRSASQSMIGYDNSKLPVHGQIIASEDRILNLYKTTGDAERKPLANIEFEIYWVGTLEDYLNGRLPIGTVPTEADLARYITADNLIATVKTDENGLATYNFGRVDGVYLVRELANDVIETPVDPFFVSVSTIDPSTNEPVYTVNVYPKNTVITEDVTIDKDVTEVGSDHDTFAVGETHTWIIQSSIPSGMATGLRYEITDVLDYRLTYQGNLLVSVALDHAAAKSETMLLTENVDYTLYVGTTTDDQGRTVDTFTVSLTAEGIQKVAGAAAADEENTYEVRVYFDCVINTNAGMGQQIPNQAHVDYTNNVGVDYDADSDKPEVHTGGLHILKVDAQDGDVLEGAIFRIARLAAAGETPDMTVNMDGEPIALVFVDFYSTADLSDDPVSQAVTGTDGTAVIYGLAYGDYYLVETAAPAGYNKLPYPVAVKITAESHLTESDGSGYVIVENSAQFLLPETGGIGVTFFYMTGFSMILVAVALFILANKVRKIE